MLLKLNLCDPCLMSNCPFLNKLFKLRYVTLSALLELSLGCTERATLRMLKENIEIEKRNLQNHLR